YAAGEFGSGGSQRACPRIAVPRDLRSATRLRVTVSPRRRYGGRKRHGGSSESFRIGEACRTWSFSVSEMELWHGCGSDWSAIRGERVLSARTSFQRFVACCQGGFGRCSILYRTRNPRQNGRPRHGSARQRD